MTCSVLVKRGETRLSATCDVLAEYNGDDFNTQEQDVEMRNASEPELQFASTSMDKQRLEYFMEKVTP